MKHRQTVKERWTENWLYAPWMLFAVLVFTVPVLLDLHNTHKRYQGE